MDLYAHFRQSLDANAGPPRQIGQTTNSEEDSDTDAPLCSGRCHKEIDRIHDEWEMERAKREAKVNTEGRENEDVQDANPNLRKQVTHLNAEVARLRGALNKERHDNTVLQNTTRDLGQSLATARQHLSMLTERLLGLMTGLESLNLQSTQQLSRLDAALNDRNHTRHPIPAVPDRGLTVTIQQRNDGARGGSLETGSVLGDTPPSPPITPARADKEFRVADSAEGTSPSMIQRPTGWRV